MRNSVLPQMPPMAILVLAISTLHLASWSQTHARPDHQDPQRAWTHPVAELNDQPVDLLEGPLEYSWSNHMIKTTRHLSGAVPGMVRLEDLESAFDISSIKSRLEAVSNREMNSPLDSNEKPHDCVTSIDAALESSRVLVKEINKVMTASPAMSPVLQPLLDATMVLAQETDSQATVATMRSLEMGLIGLHHITSYMTEQMTTLYLPKVIADAEVLRRKIENVARCEDSTTNPDFVVPLASSLRPSCRVVQALYDGYLDQVKVHIENQASSDEVNKSLFQAALASLQFQTAGAYLTFQGAQEMLEQLEEMDHPQEAGSLFEMMSLVIGAGDALQACQASVQKGAIRQATQGGSVADFEKMLYSHLGMSAKRRDPTMQVDSKRTTQADDGVAYQGCRLLLKEAITSVRAIEADLGMRQSQSTNGADMAVANVLLCIGKIEERLKAPLEESVDPDLGQLETTMTILIRIVKDLPPLSAYQPLKQSLGLLQPLEARVHDLGSCVSANAPSKLPTTSLDSQRSEYPSNARSLAFVGSNTLRCDFLADIYRGSLAQLLRRVNSITKEEDPEMDNATAEFLQGSLQGLAEAADVWDADEDAVGRIGTGKSLDALLRVLSRTSSAGQSKTLGDLSEFIPFVIAQANSLEACSNVWRATHGTISKVDTGDAEEEIDDRDLDEGLGLEDEEDDEEDGDDAVEDEGYNDEH
ncbi:hypothetical protein B0O80DRAFT_262596 [Mortierella sp. GBAus27b]|nr:hypothetical protein BGX31_006074 [Mortierella sp. GBA43]KAI8345887.1 hypothetical protein B0O80DRAFT_262596 [Mortierella sp. GBAus27b]